MDIILAHDMKSNLSSNGTNVAALNALSERFDRESLRIGISLNDHPVSEELHEYIIRRRPVLKSVPTETFMVPKSGKPYIGMPGIEYFLLYPDMADRHGLDGGMPFYRFYEALSRLKKRYHGLEGVFCSGFVCREEDGLLKAPRCPAGTTKISVTADGAVYPCYLFFRYKEFVIGNIIRDDFRKILESPILDYFRTFSKNNCPETGCPLFPSCHGGCPAMSYLYYHDLHAPDPRCARLETLDNI